MPINQNILRYMPYNAVNNKVIQLLGLNNACFGGYVCFNLHPSYAGDFTWLIEKINKGEHNDTKKNT